MEAGHSIGGMLKTCVQLLVPSRPFPANFSIQLPDFVAAIRDRSPTPVPGEAGLDACGTLFSVYQRDEVR